MLIHTHVDSENKLFSTMALLILLMSAFFTKNKHFFVEIVPLLKTIVRELCERYFRHVFGFCKIIDYY